MKHIAQERVDVACQLTVGRLVDAFNTSLQRSNRIVVVPHAIERNALVIIESDLVRVVKFTFATGDGHLFHIAALEHNLKHLKARFGIVWLNIEQRIERLQE